MREAIPFGAGLIELAGDGTVAAVRHPSRGHSMLLDDAPGAPEAAMHDPSRYWGTGFVITDRGSHRFGVPAQRHGTDLLHRFGGLELQVERCFDEDYWTEGYELRNVSDEPITIGSLAMSTPWRDLYSSSRESLQRAVHAHVWTGGADSWVWAVPMDGSGPGLGLQLTGGELWSYSVESREPRLGSNVRGHLYLHLTDHARAPHAMGGQPRIRLGPGEAYRWAWRLGWHDDLAAFHSTRSPLLDADPLAAETGVPIEIRLAPGASGPTAVTSSEAGVLHVEATAGTRGARIAVLFHPPLREIVERRVRFVLDHQRPVELDGSRRSSFVPLDTAAGLRVSAGNWRDWSDGRERVGMAVLLQAARDRGWGDPAELGEALAGYERFVVEHLVADDGTVRDDSRHPDVRLYNFPWFARFLLGQDDLDRAVRIVDRYYALGGDHYLAFDLGPLLDDLRQHLLAAGRTADADRMRRHLLGHAQAFVEHGDDLPPHEVNYEQSMVAPLLELLISAHRVAPDAVLAEELTRRLPWLTAFAADQPDVRLRHIPIRHWDGYWFGALRLWGDVFPHYWSVLSAAVYLSWPAGVGEPSMVSDLRARGQAILRANLVNFFPDGSATCAFVYPSAVDGRPAHVADPLANDQDWALVYALRLGQ
jgi:hypothetical protein